MTVAEEYTVEPTSSAMYFSKPCSASTPEKPVRAYRPSGAIHAVACREVRSEAGMRVVATVRTCRPGGLFIGRTEWELQPAARSRRQAAMPGRATETRARDHVAAPGGSLRAKPARNAISQASVM